MQTIGFMFFGAFDSGATMARLVSNADHERPILGVSRASRAEMIHHSFF